MIRREIREWGYLPVGAIESPDGLTRVQADRLLSAARSVASGGSEGERILIDGGRRLRAQQTVGILVTDGVTLEILPKIDADAATVRRSLVHMLAEVYALNVDVGAVSALGWQSETILELLIRLFCDKLFAVLRRGLPRAYLAQSEDLGALRGRRKRSVRGRLVRRRARPAGRASSSRAAGLPAAWRDDRRCV